ncbi:MAG: hypothetical protein ACHWZW_03820 [Spirulina sp.]
MVRPVETIRRDIERLTEATDTLAAEFRRLYQGYLDSLGIAVRRQVVMATYHLCTQVYPEGFLTLSVSQREHLQRDVRRLGQSGQTQLGQLLESAVRRSYPDPATDGQSGSSPAFLSLTGTPNSALRFLPGEMEAEGISPASEVAAAPDTSEMLPSEISPAEVDTPEMDAPEMDALGRSENFEDSGDSGDSDNSEDSGEEGRSDLPLPDLLKSMVLEALAEEQAEIFGQPLFTGEAMTPTRLAKQHIFLEQQIRDTLQHLSKQVNQRLQEAQVIPNLPEAVLDAASETEMGPMRGRAVPNVLSVIVAMASAMDDALEEEDLESDSLGDDPDEDELEDEDEDSRDRLMTHLAAVHLRLTDLEFGDVQASMWRSKLHNALGHLRKIGKQYQKVQREMAIAEAEQAWRAVWYDET